MPNQSGGWPQGVLEWGRTELRCRLTPEVGNVRVDRIEYLYNLVLLPVMTTLRFPCVCERIINVDRHIGEIVIITVNKSEFRLPRQNTNHHPSRSGRSDSPDRCRNRGGDSCRRRLNPSVLTHPLTHHHVGDPRVRGAPTASRQVYSSPDSRRNRSKQPIVAAGTVAGLV